MNIPLIGDVAKQDINTSLIAIRNAINELNNSSNKSNADIQKQIDLINKQIKEFNIKFGDIDTHLNAIDSDITDLQPVDTVASGNMQSVTSNAVFNTLSNVPVPVYWQDANHNDPLAEAEAIVTNAYSGFYSRFASFRLGNALSQRTPYGNNVDTDFYYQLYKIEDSNYISMLAFDIRSDRIYTISKVNGIWGSWRQFQLGDRVSDVAPIINPSITLGWARLEYRNGVYCLFARFFDYSTPATFTDGMIIGSLKTEYRPVSGVVDANIFDFANRQNYLLDIDTYGTIRIYGVSQSENRLYDIHIDCTYVN